MSFLFSQPAPGVLPANSVDFSEVETIGASTLLGNKLGAESTIQELSVSDVSTLLNLASLQPLDSDLTAIAGLSPANDDLIQRKSGAWTNRTPAQFKTDLSLTKSDVGLSNVANVDQTNASNISSGTLSISYGGTGQTTANAAFNALAPSQATNGGKYLTTDGSNTSWATISLLPSQTSNANKVLVTDGTNASWQFAGLGGGALGTGNVVLGAAMPTGLVGTNNTLCGVSVATALTSGNQNTLLGASTAQAATGSDSVILGYSATAGASNHVVIGSGASSGSGSNMLVIGKGGGRSNLTGGNSILLGNFAVPSYGTTKTDNIIISHSPGGWAVDFAQSSVLIGNNLSLGSATNAVVIGYGARSSGVAVGYNAIAGGGTVVGKSANAGNDQYNVALGYLASATGSYASLALGGYARSTVKSIVIGNLGTDGGIDRSICFGGEDDDYYMTSARFGKGGKAVTSAASVFPFLITGVVTSGSNISAASGTMTLGASQGTGTGAGGDVILSTAPAGAAGSSLNSHVERIRCKSATEVVVNDTGVDFDFRVEGISDANLLMVDAGSNMVGIGTTSPATKLHAQQTSAATSTVTNVLRVDSQSSGTPANGIGVGIEMAVETSSGNTEIGVVLEAVTTDVTSTSEDFDFVVKTMAAGGTAAERMKVASTGTVTVANGDMILNTAGNGLKIKTGADATAGLATISNGNSSVTVNTNKCSATSIILVTNQTSTAYVAVTTKTSGSFKIEHANAVGADQECAWFIINPA